MNHKDTKTRRSPILVFLVSLCLCGGLPAATLPLTSQPLSLAVSSRHLLILQDASLTSLSPDDLRPASQAPLEGAFLGLTVHPKGDRVFVSAGSQVQEFLLQKAGLLQPARRFPIPKSDLTGDLTLTPDARFLYVANPLRNTLTVLNALTGFPVSEVVTGRRPYRVVFAPDGKAFFVSHVADGNIGQYNTADGGRLATIPVGPHPTDMVFLPGRSEQHEQYIGRLFVTTSNTNTVVVLGLTRGNNLELLARVSVSPTEYAPLGSTPSALALSPDGKRLYVACSDNNTIAVVDIDNYEADLAGFLPTIRYPIALRARGDKLYIAGGTGPGPGALSVVTAPRDEDLAPPPDLPKPQDWNPPPIRHVIYILTGGRPLDGPNSKRFVRLDQFYPSGDSPATGYQWSTAAIANHWVQKLWRHPDLFQTFEPAAFPPAGYLWTNALAAGLTVRNWGLARGPDPALSRYTRPADSFLQDFTALAGSNTLPHLLLARLDGPDPDAALGRLAETLRESPAWPRLAVFIAPEYPAAPGQPSPALLLSPFAKPCPASLRYNSLSLLRTIELLLGLQPMTQFDSAAYPLAGCFSNTQDPTPKTR